MDEVVYSVVQHPSGWAIEVDGVPLLTMRSRDGALAIVEDAARIEDRRVDGEDAVARDQPDRAVLDAPGALQVRVQVAEREAVRERQLLNHLLLNYQGSAAAPAGRASTGSRPSPTDTEER